MTDQLRQPPAPDVIVDEAPVLEPEENVESLELDLLTQAIFRRYGTDFRNYARASLRRRVAGVVDELGLRSISALQERVLHDPPAMERLLLALSVNVTSMFRDPSFFRALRTLVIPHLKAHPFVRIWHTGCATGEEVYSTAIVLAEEGVLDRCRIYATDMNEVALKRARDGIYPLDLMKDYSSNYIKSGGQAAFSDYYTANYGHAIFRAALRKHVVFSQHNLVTDGSFNEFNLILCRNVMIYFNTTLQDRVHRLIWNSLRRYGVLGLGRKESLRGTPHDSGYEEMDGPNRLYRKLAGVE